MYRFNQNGIVPFYILVAGVGILCFLLLINFLPFKNSLLAKLFPKNSSYAASPFNPGDADGDLDVDIFDYNLILTNFGKVYSNADFNGNNLIDIFDYNELLTNFGRRYTTHPSASVSSQCQKILIPAYFYPGALWTQSIQSAPAVGSMIMNPNSGPGSAVDSNYVTSVNQARNAGIKVYGYVHTSYGQRSAATVKAEIDLYKSFYQVNDIFLDEVSAETAELPYYQDIASHIRSTSGSRIILNPGTVPDEGYMGVGDIIMIFESNYSAYQTAQLPNWINNYTPDRFAHLVYAVPDNAAMQDVLTLSKEYRAGYIYVTNDVLPNPWDTLPPNFQNEVSGVNQSCGISSSTPAPTTAPSPSLFPSPSPSAPTGGIWKPALRTSWQWQLTDLPVDQNIDVEMFDIDLFDNPKSVIDSLHARGKKVICYYSAGSSEDFRPDYNQFPASVKGRSNGWAGEKWLDIRRLDILGPIMKARLDLAKEKGCDGVEPDNVDGYTNNTGFPLTYQDQLNYNIFTATEAHARGLSVGLKNDMDQAEDLLPYYDWALNEQCFQYDECETLLPFINAGKAVFTVEYKLTTNQFCAQANAMNFNSLRKNLDLDAFRQSCR